MTPIPVPTDNLYKFCALVGVVLIVVSTYYCWERSDDLLRRVIRISTDQKKETIERDSLRETIKENEKETKGLEERAAAKDRDALETANVVEALKQAHQSLLASRETLKQRDLRAAEIEGATAEAELAQMQLKLVRWVGAAGIIIGIHLATYGFVQWRKIQLIQDDLLLKQQR